MKTLVSNWRIDWRCWIHKDLSEKKHAIHDVLKGLVSMHAGPKLGDWIFDFNTWTLKLQSFVSDITIVKFVIYFQILCQNTAPLVTSVNILAKTPPKYENFEFLPCFTDRRIGKIGEVGHSGPMRWYFWHFLYFSWITETCKREDLKREYVRNIKD